MRDRLDEITGTTTSGADVEVVLVAFTTDEQLDEYQRHQQLPFPILLDPDRSVYADYGLERGSFLDVWGWHAIKRYWEILRPGGPGSWRDLSSPTEDTRQLGGDMVIGPDGRLAWGHWSGVSTDRPSVDEIAEAVRRARHGATS